MKINLRDKVKDTITEFRGIVTARCVYLNGCIRCQVQPSGLNKDGEIIESQWIDEGQLIIEETDFFGTSEEVAKKEPGGPMERPKGFNNPK